MGPLSITFSGTPRRWELDPAEIDKLEIGKDAWSTPRIPAGKWLTVQATVGSDTAATVAASLTLSEIAGEISGTQIEKERPSHRTVGMVGAGLGGVAGGLAGGLLGGAVGFGAGAILGPAAALTGLAGVVYGAKRGADLGGVGAGRAAESLAHRFDREVVLYATLTKGTVTGELHLHYEPYVKLSFSALGFSWLATLDAALRTRMDLVIAPSVNLAGNTQARLVFSGGKLIRSEFELTPVAGLNLDFDSTAWLKVEARLLPFMDDSKFPGAAEMEGLAADARTLELFETAPFRLFSYHPHYEAKARLALAKGSPLEVRSTVLGVGDTVDMKTLMSKAITDGSVDALPGADKAPEPIRESDFRVKPENPILVRSTGQYGGRIGWFKGKVLPFVRQPESGELMLVYTVAFQDSPVTVCTDARRALKDLNQEVSTDELKSAARAKVALRYHQDGLHRELLKPHLAHVLLNVGPNNASWIPAAGPRTTQWQRDQIQPIGNTTGCHIDRSHSAGGLPWVADHQRPTGLIEHGLVAKNPQQLYPMCNADSVDQGVLVREILRMWIGRTA